MCFQEPWRPKQGIFLHSSTEEVESLVEVDNEDEEVDEGEPAVMLDRKSKSSMSDDELFAHFDRLLERRTDCPNTRCNCLSILAKDKARAPCCKILHLV